MTGGPERSTRELLALLDPGRADPGYWRRVQRRVVAAAGFELARRRVRARVSVEEVVLSWWRALVPAAVCAALLAMGMLLSEPPRDASVAYVDMADLLVVGVEVPEMPAFEVTAADGAIELVNEIR